MVGVHESLQVRSIYVTFQCTTARRFPLPLRMVRFSFLGQIRGFWRSLSNTGVFFAQSDHTVRLARHSESEKSDSSLSAVILTLELAHLRGLQLIDCKSVSSDCMLLCGRAPFILIHTSDNVLKLLLHKCVLRRTLTRTLTLV